MGVPNCIPSTIAAGDTLAWSRSLTDYPASDGWTLNYTLVGAGSVYNITAATADNGSDYAVSVDASTTAGWVAGAYALQEYVTRSVERHTLGNTPFTVQPNLAAATGGIDTRTQPQRMLDAINAVLEGRAGESELKVQINGRSVEYIPVTELLALRNQLKLEVALAARANGNGDLGKLYVRFGVPQ